MPLRLVTQSNAWKSNPPQPGNQKKTFSEVRLRYQSYLSEETGRTASSASTCTQPNHGCFLLCFDTVQSTGMYAFHESHRYSGNVFLWETETSSLVKSWEICELPVRSCKFIARRSQFICASDDMHLRVYNYNTMEKIKAVEAHADYIRFVEIHPTMPFILSASDDMSMKIWNWEQNWECTSTFEGHAHYVMMCKFNPKDANTFASASLDRTIKVWGLGAQQPHFSLEGHERGVNCLDYYPGGDKPYLLSGADDKSIKIWDYQTKCAGIQTLEGHSNNVCSVLFHPRLPVLVSASEDGTVRLWHATTYRAETTLNYGLERAWSIAAARESNGLAIGYDEGTVLIKLGHDAPVASLDTHSILASLYQPITTTYSLLLLEELLQNLQMVCNATFFAHYLAPGEKLNLVMKDMGSCEIFPQIIEHNCNGRFLVICGDGEYIIYTSQALRNKAFGQALDFAWSAVNHGVKHIYIGLHPFSQVGTGDFATRESSSRVKIFRNFKEHQIIKPPISMSEGIFGGACLAVRGADCVCFFDWNGGDFICKIDAIFWNEVQEIVLLVCEEQAFVLNYMKDLVENAVSEGTVAPEIGVPGAFEPEHEISGKIENGQWVGDCFVFSNGSGRLLYFVGGVSMTLTHLDQHGAGPLFMLGYLPKEDRVYFIDRSKNVFSYTVLLSVLQYQTAVVRCDFDAANAILPAIPESEHSSVARFLEAQGYKDVALQVSKDNDHKFDLALELGCLNDATALLDDMPSHLKDTTDSLTKWKRLGDLALTNCDLKLAERCAENAKDLAGLLMLYTAMGDRDGVSSLANEALSQGKQNIAFLSFFILGEVENCYELLIKTKRIPEAALFARTFLPSRISHAVKLWREDLTQISERAAAALADPSEYPNLFPDLDWALKLEQIFKQNRSKVVPASTYQSAKDDLDLDLISLMKEQSGRSLAEIKADAVVTVPQSQKCTEQYNHEENSSSCQVETRESLESEADAILNNDFGDDDDDW